MDVAGRIGKAAELAVAATVIIGTSGKVNVATAIWDDDGVDLTFFTTSASMDVQVKSRTLQAKTVRAGRFIAELRQATFRPRPNLWILFCIVDTEDMTVGPFWLMRYCQMLWMGSWSGRDVLGVGLVGVAPFL